MQLSGGGPAWAPGGGLIRVIIRAKEMGPTQGLVGLCGLIGGPAEQSPAPWRSTNHWASGQGAMPHKSRALCSFVPLGGPLLVCNGYLRVKNNGVTEQCVRVVACLNTPISKCSDNWSMGPHKSGGSHTTGSANAVPQVRGGRPRESLFAHLRWGGKGQVLPCGSARWHEKAQAALS